MEQRRCLQDITENWRRRKLGWDRREGKNHEFNFGLESEVIIDETHEWRCRVAAGYMGQIRKLWNEYNSLGGITI